MMCFRIPPAMFGLLMILAIPHAAHAAGAATPSWAGPLGLNTVPSARMDPAGTVRLNLSTLDPYMGAAFSFQIAEPLSIAIRQTAQVSSLRGDADRLYPGVDLKLRLLREGPYAPEISVGAVSAYGHKRMASEYLALSKRYENFDFTGGIGWGRMASGGHISNPLKIFGSHFNQSRNIDIESPNTPGDWFTGDDSGFFAGVEYFTPVDGLSLKFDWGADDYRVEKSLSGFDAPAPWSAGIYYEAPDDIGAGIGVGIVGGEKIVASLNLRNHLAHWPDGLPKAYEQTPAKHVDAKIKSVRMNGDSIWARASINPFAPIGQQIGRVMRSLSEIGGKKSEALYITPRNYGLSGPTLRVMRHQVDALMNGNRQGSPAEIWGNMAMPADVPDGLRTAGRPDIWPDDTKLDFHWRILLDNQFSLSEEDGGFLYRTSGVIDTTTQPHRNTILGAAFRLNGGDNLAGLSFLRDTGADPVRGDIEYFAGNRVSLDRLYATFMTSATADLHIAATGGYLEEMYAGYGGEVLYRPFGKTFAVGAEIWRAWHRDPYSTLTTGLSGHIGTTGFFNAWYEFPDSDLIAGLKIGRYLGGDYGATATLDKNLNNGVRLGAFVTATNDEDPDLFGGTTNIYSGLRLSLPLWVVPGAPAGSALNIAAAPMGRNAGQILDTPLPLYEVSEPLSYRAMERGWNDLTR